MLFLPAHDEEASVAATLARVPAAVAGRPVVALVIDDGSTDRIVEPILAGRADYVVGSRFAGRIERMSRARQLGNRAFTRVLSWLARRPIGDGQSGYRALSPEAAADAEIVHDYNYAQVPTLDLLRKGFRYVEVPISYHSRETGRSFVRPLPYLRHVVPAVIRELSRT